MGARKKAARRKPVATKFEPEFDERNLWSSVIAIPLLEDFETNVPDHDVVIDLNLDCRGGRLAAREKVLRLLRELKVDHRRVKAAEDKSRGVEQYLFINLTADQIRKLVVRDQTQCVSEQDLATAVPHAEKTRPAAKAEPPRTAPPPSQYVRVDAGDRVARNDRAIYRIWPDFPIDLRISKSISTVKADAAHRAFYAYGEGIVWAVIDSGIEEHAHFTRHDNLRIAPPVAHRDFSTTSAAEENPLFDGPGHGTHVAGIIGGELMTAQKEEKKVADKAKRKERRIAATVSDYLDQSGQPQKLFESIPSIAGMAPRCKLVSLRIAKKDGTSSVSNVIAALTYIQEINGHGRRLLIHGVNMSLGYQFDPKWFACGQSPLCVEVDRLVRSGVVVVIAAGNAGYALKTSAIDQRTIAAGESLTIKDPGNSDLAITVGSTHRDMPHLYGVSYFSSKGPTGDGRLKPDLLAPGEKILSCAAKSKIPGDQVAAAFRKKARDAHDADNIAWYVQDSGTSMAAPHVSGVIAAFLSVRREFIGRPEEVKRIFMQAATDLGRERYFQGSGLVDLMRAIQSV